MFSKIRIRSPYCTNCGKPLQVSDNFCRDCGQENDNKRQSFGRIMSDLVQGFLSIDSRLAHSLPALLFRPGFLTNEFLQGRRQRYLDPVRMFITIVVIYFILSSFGDTVNTTERTSKTDSTQTSKDSSVYFDEGPFKILLNDSKEPVTLVDSSGQINDQVELDDPHYIKIREMVSRGITDADEILDSLNIESTLWNRFYYGEVIKFAQMDFDNFKDFLISKLPWFVFFLMPVFALLLKLLYIRREFLYIDHLIFAFHLHSFLFLLGILYLIILKITGYGLTGWFVAAGILYICLAFKNFYSQTWLKSLLKIALLWLLYLGSALFTFLLSLMVMFVIY